MENWKTLTIEGLEDYQVSDLGRIRRRLSNGSYRLRTTSYRKRGYEVISLRNHNYRVHRLVAMCFVDGRTKDRNEVNHINGIKDDNKASNLQWVTGYENSDHAKNVLKTGSINIPVICFNKRGDKIAEFTSKTLARKWGFKPSEMMESSVYTKELALERINKPRKKHEYNIPRIKGENTYSKTVPELLRQQVVLDLNSGSSIKDIVDKYSLSRYKIDLIIKSNKK